MPWRPRLFHDGGYPCCCPTVGSTRRGSSLGKILLPPGSSLAGSSVPGPAAKDIVRGSSFAGIASCPFFEAGASPAVLRVDIEGVANQGCGDCDLLNGVYFVEGSINEFNACLWFLVFDPVCGFYDTISVRVSEDGIGSYSLLWGLG